MRSAQFSQATRIFTFVLIAVLVVSGIGLSLNLPVSACTNEDCGRWLDISGEIAGVLVDTGGIMKQVNPAEGEKQDYRQTPTGDYFNQQAAGRAYTG